MALSGAPSNGDQLTVKQNNYAALSGGNATALMNLRDVAMFDGAALTDGYASLIATIGIRSQSANYSAEVSTNIAVNAEKNRAGVSGVNLDEELVKLTTYQQSYNASTRIIQAAKDLYDILLNMI